MILRRRRFVAACALVLLVAGAALGQYRRELPKGPRAVAVIEWDAKGRARLVPVSILIDGRWYDANLYKATPVPMALGPETVYEATKNGDPAGLFTLTEAAQQNGAWFGLGKWREGVEPPKTESKPKAAAAEPDERPVLRRPGSQPKPETPPAAPKPEAQTDKPAAPPATAPAPTKSDEDLDRPVLRRNQSKEEQAPALAGNVNGASIANAKGKSAELPAPQKVLVAISDAKHNDFRSFDFAWKPDEQKKMTQQMTELAQAELNAYAKRYPGPAPAAQLQDLQVRVFDLDLSNEPELVLTARAGEATAVPAAPRVPGRRKPAGGTPAPQTPAPLPAAAAPNAAPQTVANGVEFYVTIVARQDVDGALHRLFTSVTDSRHLDVRPRMQLIDAVDADGNNRGELLFRQINDQGRTFIIYRAGPDQLSEVYDGSGTMRN